MARPRVFISSTFYDLKHIRSSLDHFVRSLGFEPVLSEAGGVAYSADEPLDESCYAEVKNVDIFVLIIGGRYGSEVSGERNTLDHGGDSNGPSYVSVTRKEFETASESGIPCYVLVESSVLSEFETYKSNVDNPDIKYAHVDSVNVYRFIEFVFARSKNNPVQPFERSSDIEAWLREQWAGYFRELLRTRSERAQLASLSSEVSRLNEVNETLKIYLEEVVRKVSSDDAAGIIAQQQERMLEANVERVLGGVHVFEWLSTKYDIDPSISIPAVTDSSNYGEFVERIIGDASLDSEVAFRLVHKLRRFTPPLEELNQVRRVYGLDPFVISDLGEDMSE